LEPHREALASGLAVNSNLNERNKAKANIGTTIKLYKIAILRVAAEAVAVVVAAWSRSTGTGS